MPKTDHGWPVLDHFEWVRVRLLTSREAGPCSDVSHDNLLNRRSWRPSTKAMVNPREYEGTALSKVDRGLLCS